MNKTIMFLGMLAVGFANAQQYDGKVGVNTDQPSATLNVKSKTGTDATTKNLELQNANGKQLVTVLDNGNVGIGTDAPVTNLQIDYEGDNPIKIRHKTLPLTDGNLKSQIVFADKDDNAYGYIGDISRLQRLGLVGVNYIVGIGSNKRASFDNPSATNILAQTDILVNSEDDNNRILLSVYNQENPDVPNFGTVIDNWGRWHIGWENTEIDNRGDAKVNIRGIGSDANSKNLQLSSHNNTRLLTVLNNGNVGFGTETPKHRLHIENDQWYPIAIQNTSYETSNGALKSSIVFKDKDGNSYGYVGDVSSHKRLSLVGQLGYQVSMASSKLTGSPNATVVLDPENDIDRIVLQTIDEDNNRVNNTYIDKQGNWRVGVSAVVPEKFAIGGNLRVEGLKGTGDRPVYVDSDGVLKAGAAVSGLGATGLWKREGDEVKLAVLSDGTDRTQDNTVSINDKGEIYATSLKGKNGASIFPDYVFQKYYTGTSSIKLDYNFKTLSQVEGFVKSNGHLPGYKSAEAIKAQGYIDVMETQISNVEKIEELYLHTIEQEKALKEKDAKIKSLEERLERLEKLIK